MKVLARKLRTLANLLATMCPLPGMRHRLFRFAGVVIGKGTYINMQVRMIIAPGSGTTVVFGERVAVAPGAVFAAISDPNESRLRHFFPDKSETIRVGDDAWIGANAVVLPGVRIGRMAVVGAGAVVVRDVEPGQVVAGVPATALRSIPLDKPVTELDA